MTQNKKTPILIILITGVIIALGAGAVGIFYTKQAIQTAPQQTDIIGGGFQLLSPSGNVVSTGSFRGRWMLMYFGASRCLNDQCSQNLNKMGKIMELLGKKSTKVIPIFISFDSQYDTPDRLMLYMKHFNNKIIALTGGDLAIRDISILYHVPLKTVQATEKTKLIEPFQQFILMDPTGKYNQSINTDETAEQIADALSSLIQ
ncbi:SCO family protein [Commensalibacter papalotli (ex Servin-Garciduenas et al. 2014)]|uniref:Electron transport protein SCO1/SenC n=1 Tax=Commensalibacter papalotli (ex Servin-Garciduenas et al. 2014) TaxID=1208583 RepID=W7E4P6_9PROT|nr:SCO family protein [Commensalibacter papalotli (ex Servin-Garciduenas et al. 2014)]EUK18056.1 electron transport protein SCO1/SenC [Commensalibacter papalotli (ex Servin-Garciduenas et al. 2014)]